MTYAAQNLNDDGPDLEPRGPRLSSIIQAMSPELTPGPKHIEGAKIGAIQICYEDGTREAFSDGVSIITLMFAERVVEWSPRGSMTPPITHFRMPLDAEWRDVGGGRRACVRSSSGNRCEKTLYQFGLVNGFRVTFAHRSTGYQIGRDFYDELDRIKVTIDGATARMIGAKYKLFGALTPPNDRGERWYALRYQRLGILGEPGGPSIEEVRVAATIRAELRAEEARQKEEYAALAVVKPTPMLGRPGGSISYTSGNIERPRSWADPKGPAEIVDPKPAAEPAKTAKPAVDPKLNDDLDDMPWND
jgi:hypothetical protein